MPGGTCRSLVLKARAGTALGGVPAPNPSGCPQRSGQRTEAVFCLGRHLCLHPGWHRALGHSLATYGPAGKPLEGQRGHAVQDAPPLSHLSRGPREISFLLHLYLGFPAEPTHRETGPRGGGEDGRRVGTGCRPPGEVIAAVCPLISKTPASFPFLSLCSDILLPGMSSNCLPAHPDHSRP